MKWTMASPSPDKMNKVDNGADDGYHEVGLRRGADKMDVAVDFVNPALTLMADEDNCYYTGKRLLKICRKVSQGF